MSTNGWERVGAGYPEGAIRYRVPHGQAVRIRLADRVGFCMVTRIDRELNFVDVMPYREFAAHFDSGRTAFVEDAAPKKQFDPT